MKVTLLHSESTLTNRYQTTIPEPIRKVLALHKRDKISYDILSDGQVLLSRGNKETPDPILNSFLDFLEQDMMAHPEHIQAVSQQLLNETEILTSNMPEINLDESLSPEDE
jgi:antitoxin PrlF